MTPTARKLQSIHNKDIILNAIRTEPIQALYKITLIEEMRFPYQIEYLKLIQGEGINRKILIIFIAASCYIKQSLDIILRLEAQMLVFLHEMLTVIVIE
jgi:hypothetical protein